MSLKTLAQSALGQIAGAIPGAAVTVKYEGVSVTGVRDTRESEGAAQDFGELGTESGRVHVSTAEMTKEPKRGATIIVNGETSMITQVDLDPVGALYSIHYQEEREVAGV